MFQKYFILHNDHLPIIFYWQIVDLDYGDKDRNPIDKVYFFMKSQPDTPFRITKDQVRFLLSSLSSLQPKSAVWRPYMTFVRILTLE